MLRVAPRNPSPMANPAAARGAIEGRNNNNNYNITTSGRPRPSSSSSTTHLPLGPSSTKIYQSSPVKKTNFHNSTRVIGMNTSVERETMSSVARRGATNSASGTGHHHHRDPNQSSSMSTFERLAQPRSCSRNRATSPPQMQKKNSYSGRGLACGTSKDTARRFLTQELRSHSNNAVPQ